MRPSLRTRAATALRETRTGRLLGGLRDAAEGALSVATFRSARRRRRGAGVVLYHGVAPRIVDPFVEAAHVEATLFRRQIRHLLRHYRVVRLGEIVDRLLAGGPVPADWCALTFDDGYANNLSCARQILREEGDVPMSVFVVTDFMGSRTLVPTVLLKMCVMHARASRLRIPIPDRSWATLDLADRRGRANAYWTGYSALRALPPSEQSAVMEEFVEQLGPGEAEEIRSRFPSFEWLDWDGVRELASSGVEIGSHTSSHPSLGAELDETRLRAEIEGSLARVRAEVGRVSSHFVYPYGAEQDVGDRAVAVLAESGIRAAFTTMPGTVDAGDDPYRLRRLVGGVGSMGRFRRTVAAGKG